MPARVASSATASCAWRLVPTNRIVLPLRAQLGDKLRRVLEQLERLLQVDDVNSVALAEDVFLHLRIPALGLMPEVNTRFEQLLHGDGRQCSSFLDCIAGSGRDLCPLRGELKNQLISRSAVVQCDQKPGQPA